MNAKVLVLTAEGYPKDHIPWQDAMALLVKNKAEVVYSSSLKVHPKHYLPLVIRLIKAIRQLWKKEVEWTKFNVHIRDGFTCQYCGEKLTRKELTIDHVYPKDQGGKNGWKNTVTACFPCNNKKGNRTPGEAKMFLRKQPVQPTIMEFILKEAEVNGLNRLLQKIISDN